jgi:quercetin dioxygenase-like cupin family protein
VNKWMGCLVVMISCALVLLVAQNEAVTGDRSSPLRPLAGDGNVGVSNAVLRDQSEIRVLRVMVAPGGRREMHSHDNVQYHLFTPISASMQLQLGDGTSLEVAPWHPYFMPAGTQHGFRNDGADPVEIIEVFVR